MKPCLECGKPSPSSFCAEHQPSKRPSVPYRAAGYNRLWDKLSRRARRIQPWCSDCGSVDDLTADHSVEAWRRKEQGKAIRLRDIDVVCRACNNRRGPARGKRARDDDQVVRPLNKLDEAINAVTRGDDPPPLPREVAWQAQRPLHSQVELED